MASELTDDSHV